MKSMTFRRPRLPPLIQQLREVKPIMLLQPRTKMLTYLDSKLVKITYLQQEVPEVVAEAAEVEAEEDPMKKDKGNKPEVEEAKSNNSRSVRKPSPLSEELTV